MDRERRLLCQAGLALAAGGAAGCGGVMPVTTNDMAECSVNAVGVGNASDVALNQAAARMTPVTGVFLCRDANGLYAVDAGCTHLGCDVVPKNAADVRQGFNCPCHGATYDANGEHPTSPAPRALAHYLLCAQPSGALVVDPTVVVASSVRLKI